MELNLDTWGFINFQLETWSVDRVSYNSHRFVDHEHTRWQLQTVSSLTFKFSYADSYHSRLHLQQKLRINVSLWVWTQSQLLRVRHWGPKMKRQNSEFLIFDIFRILGGHITTTICPTSPRQPCVSASSLYDIKRKVIEFSKLVSWFFIISSILKMIRELFTKQKLRWLSARSGSL